MRKAIEKAADFITRTPYLEREVVRRTLRVRPLRDGDLLEIEISLEEMLTFSQARKDDYARFIDLVVKILDEDLGELSLKWGEEFKRHLSLLHFRNRLESLLRLDRNYAEGSIPLYMCKSNVHDIGDNLRREAYIKLSKIEESYRRLEDDSFKRTLVNESFAMLKNLISERNDSASDEFLEFKSLVEDFPFDRDYKITSRGSWRRTAEILREYVSRSFSRLEAVFERLDLHYKQKIDQIRVPEVVAYIDSQTFSFDMDLKEELKELSWLDDSVNLLYPEGEGEDKLKRKVQLVYSLIHFNRLSFEEIDFSSGEISSNTKDSIKYQFPLHIRYLAEEGQNSLDHKSSKVVFKFCYNGCSIEDDGLAMEPQFLFGTYPLFNESKKLNEKGVVTSRGRLGIGSKAKLVEVLEGGGEVIVISKSESPLQRDKTYRNRYSLKDGELFIGFSKASRKKRGVTVNMFYGDRSEYGAVKGLVFKGNRLRELNRKRETVVKLYLENISKSEMQVYIGRKRINKQNPYRFTRLTKVYQIGTERGTIQAGIDYRTQGDMGEFRVLSGDIFFHSESRPFNLVVNYPVVLDPVEGRDHFVKSQAVSYYNYNLVKGGVIPYLEYIREEFSKKEQLRKFESVLYNFLQDRGLFEDFYRRASKEEITGLLRLHKSYSQLDQGGDIVSFDAELDKNILLFLKGCYLIDVSRFPGIEVSPHLLDIGSFLYQNGIDSGSSTTGGSKSSRWHGSFSKFFKEVEAGGIEVFPINHLNGDAPLPFVLWTMKGKKHLIVNLNHRVFRTTDDGISLAYLRGTYKILNTSKSQWIL